MGASARSRPAGRANPSAASSQKTCREAAAESGPSPAARLGGPKTPTTTTVALARLGPSPFADAVSPGGARGTAVCPYAATTVAKVRKNGSVGVASSVSSVAISRSRTRETGRSGRAVSVKMA